MSAVNRQQQIFEQFRLFHRDHPEIYRLFERFTFELIEAGFEHYSSDAVVHRIRWHLAVDTRDQQGFKINNNFCAYFSRLFAVRHPGREEFFRERFLISATEAASDADQLLLHIRPACDSPWLTRELEQLAAATS